ncbi:MAG TPA: VWA domain-containing protein [Thermoleophilaceae bacterium]
MSFREPAFLAALALVPLAVALYLHEQRGRRRAGLAFATAATMPSVAPQRPRWRRHLPMIVYGAAAAALAIALARPEATVAVPDERASVVLALDQSGSMAATDVAPSRLQAVKSAADTFLDGVPGQLRVGAVAFNHKVRRIAAPSRERDGVRALVDGLRPSGGTATGEALEASVRLVRREARRAGKHRAAAIVLLSDGESTHGRDPIPVAREAAKLRVPIYTVALGTDAGTIEVRTRDGGTTQRSVPPDPETMRQISRISHGRTFDAKDAHELSSVYASLGSRVGTRKEQRELTAAFAGVAALLMAGGGLMSLRWFGRLP